MEHKSYRSMFWPIVLIGVGVIWLLGSLGVIPNANFAALLSMWPIILIIFGLDILIGRRSAFGGAIVGLVAVALIAVVLIVGPSFGLATGGTLKSQSISADIGESLAADINLALSTQPLTLAALDDKTTLLKGEIDYYGTLAFDDAGTNNRRISLRQSDNSSWNIPWDPNARWEIDLTPNLPIDLSIEGASGSAKMDLSELRLTGFTLDQGSGSVTLELPTSTQPYTATLSGGSGSLTLTLPAESDLTLRLDRGSGSTNITIPAGIAVRLEIRDSGSGSVNLPEWLDEVRVYEGGKEGTWETTGFDQAAHKLIIICDDLGSGSFNVH